MSNTLQSKHEALKSTLQAQMLEAKRQREAADAAVMEAQREMAVIEQYEELMRRKEQTEVSTQVQAPTPSPLPIPEKQPTEIQDVIFATLTKELAAMAILKEAGAGMRLPVIFEKMKERGHPVLNQNSLRTLMSRSSKFRMIGNGIWGLSELGL